MTKTAEAAPWLPTLATPPLSDDFVTDGDRLLQIIDLAWKSPEQKDFELDEWQRWLVRRVLERYPDDWHDEKKRGQLRYRQVLISMGRQNGKSVLGAVFALYGLLAHVSGPEVVSVASTVPQANIIYDRVRYVVNNNASLKKRYKVTGTRGIRSRVDAQPATYFVKAGAENSLQGVTISLCLFDEVHICPPESWNAVVFGTSARRDGMVLGITTAGDENSELLKSLYKTGRAAAVQEDDHDERFGFFLWEAPEHLNVTDPEALIAANPSIACGRMDVEQEINAIRNMPENQARRYRLNQFVSSETSWLPMAKWNALAVDDLPHHDNIVFAVDRTDNWTAATITASVRHLGKTYTKVVASFPTPTLEALEGAIVWLSQRYPRSRFVMEVSNLRDLAMRVKERGIECEYLTQSQMVNASALVYSLINEGSLVHAGDDLLRNQVPKGVAKNVGEGWRISRRDSVGDVDALMATVMGAYYVNVATEKPLQLFVA